MWCFCVQSDIPAQSQRQRNDSPHLPPPYRCGPPRGEKVPRPHQEAGPVPGTRGQAPRLPVLGHGHQTCCLGQVKVRLTLKVANVFPCQCN